MKRIIALLLSLCLIISGCASTEVASGSTNRVDENTISIPVSVKNEIYKQAIEPITLEDIKETELYVEPYAKNISYSGLDDCELLTYVENSVYSELVAELNSDLYFVENIDAIYVSKEYLEELAYNSEPNVFFGYTLEELEKQFQGARYVFTLGESGQTEVQELAEVYDDTYNQIIRNVTIGSGVILLCVTVSIVSAGLGAPAVSMIFAASAKTGTFFALSSSTISGVAAGIVRGYQTHDFEQAMEAGLLTASEGFKWGAIIGSVSGGMEEGVALKGATLNGLTMNEAAAIQQTTKWPLEAIKNIHSMAEYEIYKEANLLPVQFTSGEWAFIREIDWKLVDSSGNTNVERVMNHLAPIDSTGMPYELHHIGQRADSPLAILTYSEHHLSGNYATLHYAEEGKNVSDAVWKAQKKDFWNVIINMAQCA